MCSPASLSVLTELTLSRRTTLLPRVREFNRTHTDAQFSFSSHKPADHYGPAEIVFVSGHTLTSAPAKLVTDARHHSPPLPPPLFRQGQFQEHLPPRTVLGGTKWCIFKPGEELSRSTVEAAVRERMTRMRTSHLDFLQVRPVFCLSHSAFGPRR